jgi:hypothetical protein
MLPFIDKLPPETRIQTHHILDLYHFCIDFLVYFVHFYASNPHFFDCFLIVFLFFKL